MPELESQKNTTIFSLTEPVLEAFCDDISSMFAINLDCEALEEQQEANIEDLRKKFRKLSAAFRVSAEGFLNGDFWVLLDSVGLFVLSGVFVMLPEKVVTQRAKSGTLEEANNIYDALGEVGNMLVGSWDRVYREQLDGHKHLLQTHTAVNKDWASLLEALNLADDAIAYQTFKLDVASYDPVNVTIVYPNGLFDESVEVSQEPQEQDVSADSTTEDNDAQVQGEAQDAKASPEEQVESSSQEKPQEEAQVQEPPAEVEATTTEESQEVAQAEETAEESEAPAKEEPQEATGDVDNSQEETQPEPEDKPQDQENLDDTQNQEVVAQEAQGDEVSKESDSEPLTDAQEASSPQADTQAKEDKVQDVAKPEPKAEPQGPVSKAIKEMVSGATTESSSLKLSVSDIMTKDVVWANKDDSVESLISLMQSQDSDYVLIGSDQALEGVVTGTDIKGAISPYLQSMFANWRRPQDLATLQIKAKWIMSSVVNTVALDAKFSVAARLAYEKDLNVLPVLDKSGKVCGVVTRDEIMRTFMINIGIDADKPMRRAPIL